MNTSLEWMGEVDQKTLLPQTVPSPVSKPERQGLCSASLHLLNPLTISSMFPVFMNLTPLGTSYKWTHIVFHIGKHVMLS